MYLIPHSFDTIGEILDQKMDDIERVLEISLTEGRVSNGWKIFEFYKISPYLENGPYGSSKIKLKY